MCAAHCNNESYLMSLMICWTIRNDSSQRNVERKYNLYVKPKTNGNIPIILQFNFYNLWLWLITNIIKHYFQWIYSIFK